MYLRRPTFAMLDRAKKISSPRGSVGASIEFSSGGVHEEITSPEGPPEETRGNAG